MSDKAQLWVLGFGQVEVLPQLSYIDSKYKKKEPVALGHVRAMRQVSSSVQ